MCTHGGQCRATGEFRGFPREVGKIAWPAEQGGHGRGGAQRAARAGVKGDQSGGEVMVQWVDHQRGAWGNAIGSDVKLGHLASPTDAVLLVSNFIRCR